MNLIILPARLKSTRLPEKLLQKINGRELIHWTLDQALKVKGANQVVVAADHPQIAKVVESRVEVFLTDPNLPSGTDRIASILDHFPKASKIINFQADEPLLDSKYVDNLLTSMPTWADVGTLCTEMVKENFENPNAVKLVLTKNFEAVYFSRLPIPFESQKKWHHLGLYCYTKTALEKFVNFGYDEIEKSEKLEQLRGIVNGLRYYALPCKDYISYEVNTPEDLERLKQKLKI